MSLIVKNRFIKEDIIDEQGNKIGELKFNPNDSRIMNKLVKIMNDAIIATDKLKKIGELPNLANKKLETIEDFELAQSDIKKMCEGFSIETDLIDGIFNNLYEIFGKETIDIFTCGTQDIELVMPILEFVMPYVKQARQKNVDKYIKPTTRSAGLDVLE